MMPTMDPIRAKVTVNGQVSLPAAVRHRWNVESVLVVDRGEYLIIRPLPADQGEALDGLRGAFAGPGPTVEDARRTARASEGSGRKRR